MAFRDLGLGAFWGAYRAWGVRFEAFRIQGFEGLRVLGCRGARGGGI